MAKDNPRPDTHEVVRLSGIRRVDRDATLICGTPQQCRVPSWFGRRNKEELLGGWG
jgi:hypothetical protein